MQTGVADMICRITNARVLQLVVLSLCISGCTVTSQYRTDYKVCTSTDPVTDCENKSIEQYEDVGHRDNNYLLGFIEFDDQGQLQDRGQMDAVIDEIIEYTARRDESRSRNALMVVFVHGWKHNAKPDDGNVASFRTTLEKLSHLESVSSKLEGRAPRKVVGIYFGWRGESIDFSWVDNVTFWDRKNTAHKVGHGAVTEVLSTLENIRNVMHDITGEPQSHSRLVVIGHSFGGALVYSALSQILAQRFVVTQGPLGASTDVPGFADLVVLINPAFEALRFAPLSDMANARRTYFSSQLPVVTVLTSEADWATKYAFSAGRFVSTLFENHKDMTRRNPVGQGTEIISEGSADITAVGHFEPYWTHRLEYRDQMTGSEDAGTQVLTQVKRGWCEDKPGKEIEFPGSALIRTPNSVARNPYLVINVDKRIIPDHNDIYADRVAEFLRYIILLSTQVSKNDIVCTPKS